MVRNERGMEDCNICIVEFGMGMDMGGEWRNV